MITTRSILGRNPSIFPHSTHTRSDDEGTPVRVFVEDEEIIHSEDAEDTESRPSDTALDCAVGPKRCSHETRPRNLDAVQNATSSLVRETINEVIDAMIEELKSLRSASMEPDVETNDKSSELLTRQGIDFVWPPVQLGESRPFSGDGAAHEAYQEASTKVDANDVADVWYSGDWPSVTSESRKHLVLRLATAIQGRCLRMRSPFTSQALTLVSTIGWIISRGFDPSEGQIWLSMRLDHVDIDVVRRIKQHPEITARVVIEVVQILSKNMTLGQLLRKCYENADAFKPIMFSTDVPTIDDFIMLYLGIYVVTLNTVWFDIWLWAIDNTLRLWKESGSSLLSYLSPITFSDIIAQPQRLNGNVKEHSERIDAISKSHFSSNGMDISSLISIKGFHVDWTLDVSKHLTFNKAHTWSVYHNDKYKPILSIYWLSTIETVETNAYTIAMDETKLEGIHELLNDKRDSLAYYTFWGAVLLGSTTIILAFASLAVSIVQTWGTFHPPGDTH